MIPMNTQHGKEGELFLGKMGFFTELELDYYDEQRRMYAKPVYNPILEFPKGRTIMVQLYKQQINHWKDVKESYDIGDWLGEWWWEYCTEKIEELSGKIKALKQRGLKKSYKSQEDKLLKAKQVPILDVMGIASDQRYTQFVKCPFHNETNASLHIYKKTNTWYCFSCNEGTDSVDMYMKLHGVDFKEAVNKLS